MGAKRVHVSVPKMENSLSFKQRRLKCPKSTTFFLRNSYNTVTCYSSSCYSTMVGLPVIVSATNAFVSTSMSDDMKKLFSKKKEYLVLNFLNQLFLCLLMLTKMEYAFHLPPHILHLQLQQNIHFYKTQNQLLSVYILLSLDQVIQLLIHIIQK